MDSVTHAPLCHLGQDKRAHCAGLLRWHFPLNTPVVPTPQIIVREPPRQAGGLSPAALPHRAHPSGHLAPKCPGNLLSPAISNLCSGNVHQVREPLTSTERLFPGPHAPTALRNGLALCEGYLWLLPLSLPHAALASLGSCPGAPASHGRSALGILSAQHLLPSSYRDVDSRCFTLCASSAHPRDPQDAPAHCQDLAQEQPRTCLGSSTETYTTP